MANPRSYFSDKSALREAMRERLRGLSVGELRDRSIQICERLRTFFPGKNSLAVFARTEMEPDLDLLWALGALEHHLVSYPRCEGETLLFRTVSTLSDLCPGRSGIREPVGGAIPEHLRSEEHTSELQSHLTLVCRLLLEKQNYLTTHPLSSHHSHSSAS